MKKLINSQECIALNKLLNNHILLHNKNIAHIEENFYSIYFSQWVFASLFIPAGMVLYLANDDKDCRINILEDKIKQKIKH